MAEDVSVIFSAQIGALIEGVDKVKEAITSVGESANQIAGLFTNFGTALAGAFAVGEVAEFVSSMEELGERIEHTSQVLGISTKETQELGFVAAATGTSSDVLARSMEILQVNLQKAQSGAGPAAESLQALGLSAKSLIGLSLDQQFDKIADAVSRFADGGNKLAIVRNLLGRGADDLIPTLDQGSAGLDALRQAAEDSGAVIGGQTVEALRSAGTAAGTLRLAVTALGENIVGAFADDLVSASNGLTKFVAELSAMVATGNLSNYLFDAMSAGLDVLGAQFARVGVIIADFFTKSSFSQLTDDWKSMGDKIVAIQKDNDQQLNAELDKIKTSYKAMIDEIGGAASKPQAPALAVPNKDAASAAIEAAQAQIKAYADAFNQTKEILGSEVKLHELTYSQETALLLAALDRQKTEQLSVIAAEEQIGGLSVAQEQRIANEKLQIDTNYAKQRQKIIDQAVEDEAKKWQSVLQPIEGAWNSQLKALLSGSETFGQAMKNMLGDLLITFIEWCEKQVEIWLATQIAKAIISKTTGAAAGNLEGINADAGQAFAGFVAYFAPTLGPGAIPLAAGMAAGVAATAEGLASADTGGYVLTSGLANIHAGETITPASIAQPYTGGPGGGASINLNLSAFNPQGLQQLIVQMMPQLTKQLNTYQNLNPSTA
jgi:hypothetical protein